MSAWPDEQEALGELMMMAKDDVRAVPGEVLRCPKCGRVLRPWPLRRPNVCSPSSWVHCVREPAPA